MGLSSWVIRRCSESWHSERLIVTIGQNSRPRNCNSEQGGELFPILKSRKVIFLLVIFVFMFGLMCNHCSIGIIVIMVFASF